MTVVLMDTHVWVWSFLTPSRVSPIAIEAISDAHTVLVSPVSFFEITQKVRLGKWPEMKNRAGDLQSIMQVQNSSEAPLHSEICELGGRIEWPHRDPFDRLIAATALHLGIPLVSKDPAFASLDSLDTIW